ncbi:MAG: O-antigen ligase family protein [Paraglaciecola sp.]|nr:O-antigen ligase family protein [Paraglaciecola sp.]NCT46742.1 O-antigen ligase family protein [Paraglaciecola sp.]
MPVKYSLSHVLFYVFLALLVWLPIPLGSNRPWAWSLLEFITFVLLLGCIAVFRHRPYLGLTHFRAPLLCWLLFLLIALLQITPLPSGVVNLISPHSVAASNLHITAFTYLSVDVGQSQIALLKSAAYFSLFICSLLLIDTEQRIKQTLLVMVVSGTFQALYGVLEILSDTPYSLVFNLPVAESASGSFVYKNHFANYLMLCLSAGMGLIVSSLQANVSQSARAWSRTILTLLLGNKALIRISLAIMVIGLVMSHSRMGNTAFFAALTLIGCIALALDKRRSRALSWLVVSMLVIDLLIVSAWFGLDKVQQRLSETSLAHESRDEVLLDSLPMVLDFPVFGGGGGSYYGLFPSFKVSDTQAFYDHAHNDYLQFLIEYGALGFLPLAIFVCYCFYHALLSLKNRHHPTLKGTAFAACMACFGMLIHMSVDFPLQAPANAAYFVVFLALALISQSLKIMKTSRLSGNKTH